jgi:hypothetical protein
MRAVGSVFEGAEIGHRTVSWLKGRQSKRLPTNAALARIVQLFCTFLLAYSFMSHILSILTKRIRMAVSGAEAFMSRTKGNISVGQMTIDPNII